VNEKGAIDSVEALLKPSVGSGFQRAVDAQHAADAADVLDDHRLAERRVHALREAAGEDVGRPSWREGHDHAHRLGGIRLGRRHARHKRRNGKP